MNVDLLTLSTPERDNIPPVKMLQFTASQTALMASGINLREFLIYNPATQQGAEVLPPPPVYQFPASTVNVCMPFYVSPTGMLQFIRSTGASPATDNTNCEVFIVGALLTYDTSCYWASDSAAWSHT